MSTLPDPAAALCASQHNVIGRFQLREWMTEKAVEGLLRRGHVEVLERGVYAVPGGAAPPEQMPMAALLRARPDARLTGPLVLGLLGIEPFTRQDGFVVLTAPGRRLQGVTFEHRPDPWPDRRCTPIGPLNCVHPVAALVDAIAPLGRRERRVALHVLRRRGSWSPTGFEAERTARGEDAGITAVLELLEDGALESDTVEEVELGDRLRAIDDRFEPQVWVTATIRVDWFLRALRLVIEYQGDVDHGDAAGRGRDSDRHAQLAALGMRVVPVVAADLRDPGFESWIRGIVTTRSYELARGSR